MSKKSLKTTPEEFERFKQEVQRQIVRLGLQDWDFTYEHKRMAKRDFAACYYDCEAHACTMVFNTLKRTEDESPEQIAKHECAHALVAPLQDLAEERFVTQKEIDNIVEALAMKLEKIL